MKSKILILEDNAERTAVMVRCLADRFHQFEIEVFGDAGSMMEALHKAWDRLVCIALDHDLEMIEGKHGQLADPGTGREVVEFLIAKQPVCPVVIHSTNTAAAIGMEQCLLDHGWNVARVTPFDDLAWIPSSWFTAVRRAIVGPLRNGPQPAPASS
jgi:CheY-like chemotaxis protein